MTDALPWLALAGVVVLAAVAAAVLLRRRRRLVRSSAPDESYRSRPQPGEIWWAEVPFEERTGSKRRPCLVLRTHRRQVDVLKITSQNQADRPDHLEIPTSGWDKRATHNSFIDLSDSIRIPDSAFTRRAGLLDTRSWRRVRRQHVTGYVA